VIGTYEVQQIFVMVVTGLERCLLHRQAADFYSMMCKYCKIEAVDTGSVHCAGNSQEHILDTCGACLGTVVFSQKNWQHRNPGCLFIRV
jgi:hypothetical protein